MRPSLRHLEVFRVFARVESVTEAAQLLRISQPAVSQTLKELEADLGVELLVRGKGRSVRLSEAARALLDGVLDVLDRVDALCDTASTLGGRGGERLAVATTHSLATTLLPPVLERLYAQEPGATYRLEAFDSQGVVKQVADRKVDVGLTFFPVEQAWVTTRPVLMADMACMLPASHRLAGRRTLRPEDLVDGPIITLGNQAREEFDCRAAFPDATQSRFINTNDAVISMELVRQGLGIALALPFTAMRGDLSGIKCLTFEPRITRTLFLVKPNGAAESKLTALFLSELRAEARDCVRLLTDLGLQAAWVE